MAERRPQRKPPAESSYETLLRAADDWSEPDARAQLVESMGAFPSMKRCRNLWRLEAELNPRLTWLDGRTSYGLHGVIDVSRAFGPVSAGIGAFTFYDRRSDYWAWRLAAQVGVRLGQ